MPEVSRHARNGAEDQGPTPQQLKKTHWCVGLPGWPFLLSHFSTLRLTVCRAKTGVLVLKYYGVYDSGLDCVRPCVNLTVLKSWYFDFRK